MRLAGIDTPEKRQPFGQVAKDHLSRLVNGQTVTVHYHKRDRYGDIVGKVLASGADVGLRQVEAGLAWHYKQYQGEQDAPDRARYANVEIEARAARRGLWALPAAQRAPPWEWRHGGRNPSGYNLADWKAYADRYHGPGCAVTTIAGLPKLRALVSLDEALVSACEGVAGITPPQFR